jgi:hypothetical protein
MGGGWLTPRPGRFTHGKTPATHCIGGWVGPRTSLYGCGKSRYHRDFFCILLYSVLHPYFFLCLHYVLHFDMCLYLYHTKQTTITPTRFEPATPACDRQQTLPLDRSSTGNGFNPQPLQPVASRYTYWAIPAYDMRYRTEKSRLRKLQEPSVNVMYNKPFPPRVSPTRFTDISHVPAEKAFTDLLLQMQQLNITHNWLCSTRQAKWRAEIFVGKIILMTVHCINHRTAARNSY